LATCNYGVDAEELRVVEVEIINHGIKGTKFASMLKIAGYEGP